MKIDMHCHVKEGSLDAKIGMEEYIEALINKGFGGMVITDHNNYNGYRYWQKNVRKKYKDFVVLKGVEYDTMSAGHILVIMPENSEVSILEMRGMSLPALIDVVHRYGGVLGPAHPYGEKYLSFASTKYYKSNPDIAKRFDFVEIFNACEPIKANAKAVRFARKHNLAEIAGSDAHRIECAAKAFTEFSDNITCESDLIKAIKNRKIASCGGELYSGTTKERIGKFNDILLYSFWVYNKVTGIFSTYKRKKWKRYIRKV